MNNGSGVVKILLVEDNPADVDLIKEALEGSRIRVDLDHVDNGEKALAYLRNEVPYRGKQRPDLILLDLNIPRVDGREVLKEVKGDPGLKFIPVIILTTSRNDTDVSRSYDLNANCYINKPMDFENFKQVVRSIEEFWFSVVRLPKAS